MSVVATNSSRAGDQMNRNKNFRNIDIYHLYGQKSTYHHRRRLTYSRALEIVQEEEYLTEADRNIIRRRGGGGGTLRRVKRQFPFLNVSVVPDPTDTDSADIELQQLILAAFGAAGASQVVMSAGIGQPPPPPQPAQPPILTSSALPGQVSRMRRQHLDD